MSKSALDAPLFGRAGRDLATFDVLAPCSRSTWQPGHSRRLGEQGGAGQCCVHFYPFSLFPFHLQSLPPWSIRARCTAGCSDTLCLPSLCISSSSPFRTEQRSSAPVSPSFPDQYRSQSQLLFSEPPIQTDINLHGATVNL